MRDHRWMKGITPKAFLLALLLLFPCALRAEDTDGVLATVDGRNITEADIADKIAGQMVRINNQIYSAKKQAIDVIVSDQLIEQEAKKRGISRAELLQQEVNAKVAAVSDADVEKIYNTNKPKLGNKTLEEVKPQIVQQMQGSKQQERQQAFVRELRKEAKVKLLLTPPIVELTLDGAPVRGSADAPVTIVEFSDFQCPYCAKAQAELDKVREAYKDKVKLVFKDFPLAFHAQAPKAAEAARCAGDQEKYWEYHDVLFANNRALDPTNLKKYAADLKLDTSQFDTCLDSGKYAAAVKKDFVEGSRVGVSGTPAFFVNGRPLTGAQPFSAFQDMIEEVLASQ